jgi:protein-S-isoprenylcysteine O-methyltransferase Ste14
MLTRLFLSAVSASSYVEKYVLSLVYLGFAWSEASAVNAISHGWAASAKSEGDLFIDLARHLTMFLLQLFIGLFLLTSRRPACEPRNLKEIFVPLASIFFFLTYSAIPWFPPSMREALFPPQIRTPCAVAALALGIIGPAISTWGVLSLGRSFGIFVSVRDVVTRGPYRYVRHPIYLGYACIWTGLVLLNLSVAIFLIVPVHVLLFIYRARLEEARLCDSSAEYREYMRRTGFILPRLRTIRRAAAADLEDR